MSNYQHLTRMNCEEFHEIFSKIPVILLKPVDHKNKIQMLLTYKRGTCYIKKQ